MILKKQKTCPVQPEDSMEFLSGNYRADLSINYNFLKGAVSNEVI